MGGVNQGPAFRTLSSGASFLCDSMRYVAALAVASHHLLGRLDITAYAPSTPLTNLGTLGIFVFFILSGFLITYTIGRKAAADERYGLGQYLTERFVRIYLVLLPAMLLAAVVTLIATRGDIGNFGVDWSHFNVRNFLITLLMLSGVPGFLPHAETFVLLESVREVVMSSAPSVV